MFDFGSMIYTVPALLIAITIHEYAHAVTADAPWATRRRVTWGD